MYLKNYFAKIACVDIIMYNIFYLNENHERGKKIVILKNNIATRIAGKVSRYIISMHRRIVPPLIYSDV